METIEYNPLDNEQFEAFQSIPEKKKTHQRIWVYIVVVTVAALAGYLIGKSRRGIKLRNPIVIKNPETKNPRSESSPSITK